ncbi:transcriptional regulator family: Helix-loop-helix [Penicillium roqueforti]|nr:transcriptional regulator family: Helix-loop-helix [Penicillium roqueforti]KAF9244035.1 transcriptional regulator family: Helix-loop-helix [Penicillium roqueforti]KAI2670292.1 transcriptional regulator family: Helix-loop-helix [Penicillium roqueforti]KAI2672795.1 transcriptional regulator family: Helix-loop-helix [Penicillium roqueforti]KAI2718295.1 transcriptional regulator family: Helix-loop-helix [Penicillium roqueforti]KAI2734983.1 transcriptional regulator family: Helix-loop-helix [Pen
MSWPEQLHENNLISAPGEEEFSNLFDFNIPFPEIEHGPGTGNMQHSHSLPTSTGPDSDMAHLRSHGMQYSGQMEGLMDFNDNAQSHTNHGNSMPYSTPHMTPGFCAQQPSPMSQPPTHQHYMQGHNMIPPTPNSIEMHGNTARYPHRVDETDMYDGYSRMNEEQALYTPLISPAMTPLENQFRLPEYTIPGEYFTPLTSPALEAQNSESNSYQYHARQVSDMGFVPTTTEVNPLPGSSAPPSPSIIRKPNTRQRPSTANRLNNTRKVKQSPIIRAQRKRSTLATNSEEFYNSLTQEMNSTKPQNQDIRSLQLSSNEGSGQDSVSPEPLSEPMMPPPALPPPRMSPAIAPHVQSSSPGTAATPALLMRIQRNQHSQDPAGQFRGQAQLAEPEFPDDIMEDISLPEAAAPSQLRPRPNRIDTAVRTPSIPTNGTPFLSPSAHDKPLSASLAPSPRTTAMPSPSGPVPRKSDTRAASNRKRPSLSSTQASPQLRPKISPSIQPLMKGNEGMSQDALYLASKSNYQHILDGTLPSGVSYPEALAENLSSKRTNHKLAEQGRRNRINNALKEIELLIPQEFIDARSAKDAAESGGKANEKEKEKEKANQAISKATAVEMAIDYIKALKMTLDATNAKLAAAEAKLSDKPYKESSTSASIVQSEKAPNDVANSETKNSEMKSSETKSSP